MKDAKHVLVAGPSGGGKSTYAGEMHVRHDGPSVYLSTDPDLDAPDAPAGSVRSQRSGASYPRDVERAREWARSNAPVTQVIVDEAQNAPSFTDGEGPVADGMHEDRSAGVKWVIATQNPMDLRTSDRGYGPIQQADLWVWCGPLRTWHTGFFDANGMADMKDLLPTNDHEYVVIDPTASLSPEDRIVARGETDPRWSP
jgi:hypothetical protein